MTDETHTHEILVSQKNVRGWGEVAQRGEQSLATVGATAGKCTLTTSLVFQYVLDRQGQGRERTQASLGSLQIFRLVKNMLKVPL